MQPPEGDGRTQRRIEAMRRAQAAALDLFEARGFAGVSIEEVAARAGVAPATVYRNFGTKERLVLWDEYDPLLFDAIRARLPGAGVSEAVLGALVATLAGLYAADGARILRRSRLTVREPALAAAAAAERAAMVTAMAAVLLDARACRDALAADVLAGALVATLEAAVREWVRAEGRQPLASVLRRAFRRLRALAG